MKRYVSVIFMFLLLITLSGCKKNDTIWVYRDETYCADAWIGGMSDEETRNNVKKYL